jgi:hypothetical protein
MFTHHCTSCDKRQLIFFSQVTALAETDRGTAVAFTCWCGEPQTWLSGSALAEAAPQTIAA